MIWLQGKPWAVPYARAGCIPDFENLTVTIDLETKEAKIEPHVFTPLKKIEPNWESMAANMSLPNGLGMARSVFGRTGDLDQLKTDRKGFLPANASISGKQRNGFPTHW